MNNLIREKMIIGVLDEKDNVLNIAYGVDNNFLFGSGISMQSILMNNMDLAIRFHLVTDYIDDDFKDKLNQLSSHFNVEIIIYHLDTKQLKDLPTTEFWSYATYFRFFIFDLLCLECDTVLYLDADVFCKNNLKDLLNIKFNNEYAAVIPDISYMQRSCEKRLGIKGIKGKYFNAGVIFLNLKRWKNSNFTQRAFSLINEKKVKYLDQDALNILFETNNIYLNHEYNTICNIKNELFNKQYENSITSSTKLIHYTGVTKPWHYWGISYPVSKTFKDAYCCSPWKYSNLKNVDKMAEYQERYKHELKQKKFIVGILSLIKYKYYKFLLKSKAKK